MLEHGSNETANGTRTDGPRYEDVPIDQIRPNPRNPRTVFDEDALTELEHSLREFGLLQPVVVRQVDDGYELVMGERRWRAAERAGSRPFRRSSAEPRTQTCCATRSWRTFTGPTSTPWRRRRRTSSCCRSSE